jgi:uncharacterized protein (DUF58 family)
MDLPPIRLSNTGRRLLVTGVIITTAGVLSALPILALWGQIILAVLVLGYPLTMRTALRGHPEALVLTCRTPVGPGGGVVAGLDLRLSILVSNPGQAAIPIAHVLPICSSGIELTEDAGSKRLPAQVETLWEITARAVRVGPAHIYGVELKIGGPLGLFQSTSYRPVEVAISILPRSASTRRQLLRLQATAKHKDALNARTSKVKGMSTDIRELREHVSGDPFKYIAWKASARARKLIVKEFESQENLSAYVLLDIGSSMRWGATGNTRLDAAIDLTFHMARTVASQHGQFGLLSFDHELFGLTRASAGLGMPRRIMEHLLEVHAVVHEGFTSLSNDELNYRVGEFLKTHDGANFSLDDASRALSKHGLAPYDTEAIYQHVHRYLEKHQKSATKIHMVSEPSTEPRQAALRNFCRFRGIELPYRFDTLVSPKELGLARTIQRAIALGGGPHTFIVLTDLVGIQDTQQFIKAVSLARTHRHHLIFLCHEGPGFDFPQSEGSLEERLRGLYANQIHEQRKELTQRLRALRVDVRSLSMNGR